MRTRLVALLIGLGLLAALAPAGPARAQADGAVILPIQVLGTYQPVSGPELATAIKGLLAKAGKGSRAVWLSDADAARAGYTPGSQPPNNAVAAALCRQAGKRYCVWFGIRFNANMTDAAGGGKNMALSGAARLWAFDSQTGQVEADEPMSTVYMAPVPNSAALPDATKQLVTLTEQDLTQQIITVAEAETHVARVAAWAPPANQPAPPPPPASSGGGQAVQDMMAAVRAYQTAVNRGDLIGIQDAQENANRIWGGLNREQQNQVEDRYPGTEQWMRGGVWYPGTYYYPYPGRF